MKHILPILTAALAFTAATASAAETYSSFQDFLDSDYAEKYSFYNEPTVETQNGVQTINYGKYSVIKDVSTSLEYQTHFKIRANETINFYLYDYVSNYNNNSGTSLESLVSNIGYRTEGADDVVRSLGNPITSEQVGNPSSWNPDIVRNSYFLGTFEKDKEYDIFLQRNDSNGSWSWQNANDVLDSGYSLYTDTTETTPAAITSSDGFVHVDLLMAAYLAQTSAVNYNSGGNIEKIAVANAMPFAALNGVSFGMYAEEAVGSPLPGGLQIALIAGLFGLGFWYIRRRKAVAA